MPPLLAHNWPWKLASLGVAVALWVVLIGNPLRTVDREVPVEIRLRGVPAAGFHITRQETSPERLRISGPAARVQGLAAVQTDYIDIAGLSTPLETSVRTSVEDPEVSLSPVSLVTVKITIEKESSVPK